ncbi:MAG: hypothetical protein L6R38_005700 [Xanthoria sp. 2 TBL-2021]|nr:MAG: hypothetical protein L6R38_005700 [Xanthoria sp. 2 TBL-2021]
MAAADSAVEIEPEIEASTYGEEPDSAYDSEVASYTTSLASNVTNYKEEHGRRYHAFENADQKETDRLDIMHKLTEVSLGGKINLAPIPANAQRILDIGTGTGIWAIETGDRYPKAEILGNDISPIQPKWVPPNVRFEVDNVEEHWTYHQPFDYIHCRMMGNAIRDWPRLNRQCFEHTRPGGWVEFIDLDLTWTSPDGSLKESHASKQFGNEFIKASREAGIEPCPGLYLEGWMKDAGFKDVKAEKFVWPVGTWPKDKHLKEVGAWNYLQIMEGLEAFTYALFTRNLGMSKAEVEVICANIRKEIKNPAMHAMFHLHVAYGQKPEA